jgi:DNA-binding MurR/RpiR family transcriptional regulator
MRNILHDYGICNKNVAMAERRLTTEGDTTASSAPDTPPGETPEAKASSMAELLAGVELSGHHRRIAQYLEGNPRLAAFESASEVAARVHVSTATVVRFAQALGFKGWPALQLQFRQRYLAALMPAELMVDQFHSGEVSRVESSLDTDIQNLRTALQSVDPGQVDAIAHMIADARKTLIVSAGTYATVGTIIAHLGQFMGYDIQLETRGGPELMAALSLLDERDCVIGISFWRVGRIVTRALEVAQRRDIRTAAFADSSVSPVLHGVEHSVVVPTDSISFFQSMTAATSVAYGLLAILQDIGGAEVSEHIALAQELYVDLDILHVKRGDE